jgi:hypothetical protein
VKAPQRIFMQHHKMLRWAAPAQSVRTGAQRVSAHTYKILDTSFQGFTFSETRE